jgi:tRNA-dihydrouridine synthase B
MSKMMSGDKLGGSSAMPFVRGAVLAPMSGVTDVGFRRIAHRFGASLVVSEMVASRELAHGTAEAILRAEGTGLTPHMVQLAGCEAYWLAEGARVAEASGANIIDINMGCPARRVTGGWAGSALMRDLGHALGLIEAVVAAVSVPVTVKMRLGWDADTINAPALARRAAAAGVAMVTVHGRTRQQFYKGRADWAAIRRVRDATDVPLIANGDIENAADARLCLALSGADAVMVGRAALGRPWLVGQIAQTLATRLPANEPTPLCKSQAATEHYETMLSLYGTQVGVRHARKHLAAYAGEAASHGGLFAKACRHELVTCEEPGQILRLLGALYGDVPTGHLERAAA